MDGLALVLILLNAVLVEELEFQFSLVVVDYNLF